MTLLATTAPSTQLRDAPVLPAAVPVPRPPRVGEAVRLPDLLAAPDAVVWLSVHIATLDRVIYPITARHLQETAGLRAQQAATRRLAVLVRRLHAQLDGDGAVELEDLPALRGAVLAALREHSRAERDLLAQLREKLTARQWTKLSEQYAQQLQRGPHPAAPAHAAPRSTRPCRLPAQRLG